MTGLDEGSSGIEDLVVALGEACGKTQLASSKGDEMGVRVLTSTMDLKKNRERLGDRVSRRFDGKEQTIFLASWRVCYVAARSTPKGYALHAFRSEMTRSASRVFTKSRAKNLREDSGIDDS